VFHVLNSVCYVIRMAKYEDLVSQEDWLLALDGRAWIFGNRVTRRDILADEYLEAAAHDAWRHVMDPSRSGFAQAVRAGDFIVAGEEFGLDVMQKAVPLAIKRLGIGAVIARSFGHFFLRNAIHLALPALVVEETAAIKQGDRLRVDVEAHVIANKSSGDRYVIRNLGDDDIAILRSGGLLGRTKRSGDE
jgi:3-isopropylmalate/(R)-2-methylmalate dehydratase small subunit